MVSVLVWQPKMAAPYFPDVVQKAVQNLSLKRQAFSRTERIAKKRDFQQVFDSPKKIKHRFFLVLFIPNQRPYARLGIILGKHHVNRSVDRNLYRRVMRESFRQHKDLLKGLDIIVLLRSKWSPLDKKSLRVDVDTLWHKLEKH